MTSACDSYVHARDTFEPNPVTTRRYDDLYAAFRELGDGLPGQWAVLADLRRGEAVIVESSEPEDAWPA